MAERIWYPIWDSGMKLGHAVRTIDEALDLAGEDLDTASLGDALSRREREACRRTREEGALAWRENRDRMLDTMSARDRERHLEAGELAFLLEPDLKLSQGGLRDLHSLRWIDLADSTRRASGRLLPGPRNAPVGGSSFCRSTGRANNQLLLQEQDEVTVALGYGDADDRGCRCGLLAPSPGPGLGSASGPSAGSATAMAQGRDLGHGLNWSTTP